MIPENIQNILIDNARLYETAEFINGDPSWFMHQVIGAEDQEVMAFVASVLSYGSRKQFMLKIEYILKLTAGAPDKWIREGLFERDFREDDNNCFYRLYTISQMNTFFRVYRELLLEYGSLKEYVKHNAQTGLQAVEAICSYFANKGVSGVIPKDATSPCKRVCMFLRWMVRTGSPVDLGLWADIIDCRTLIIPMDTHVLQQSFALGLLENKTATMSAALRLTNRLAEVFPDDPLKGDFALFGYGVNQDK